MRRTAGMALAWCILGAYGLRFDVRPVMFLAGVGIVACGALLVWQTWLSKDQA